MIKRMVRVPFGIIVLKKNIQVSGEMVKDTGMEHIIMHMVIYILDNGNAD